MNDKNTHLRSEAVRQRRLQQIRQQQEPQTSVVIRQPRTPRPKKEQMRAKSGYRDLPPITARGVVNDFGIERRIKAQKRRFNLVFTLPRPQFHSLTRPRFQTGMNWRLLSLFLVLLIGTSLYLAGALANFRVNGAQVTGNQWITSEEINSVLGLNGYPVFLLSSDKIKDQVLLNYPELSSVEVDVSLPNNVSVHVTERQPIILWQQDGSFTWVDETGTAFRPRGDAQGLIVVQALGTPPEVSVVEANPQSLAPFIADETVKAIFELAPHVPQGTSLLYSPVTGLSWVDGRGWQVIFGTDGNINTKMLIYQAMVDWLLQQGIRPIIINVAYPQAPFFRTEQAGLQVDVEVEEQ